MLTSQYTLFKIQNFEFRLIHILIIGILILAFSTSFLIRYQPAAFGFELNEFDPFFNFRATQFIIENGFSEYFHWHDDMTWYPEGRNVSSSSQVMLHLTAATSYTIFGGDSSLYDFTIMFPVIIGSLTVFVIFGLVRVLGGTVAGLIAALLFSVSLPIVIRGTLGWFKSEPLGLFYGLLGIYLLLSGIKSENQKIAFLKVIGGGIVLGFGLASWGGIQFFVLPIGIFIFVLPFLRHDFRFLNITIPLFVVSFLFTAGLFERPGMDFVLGLGGLSLIIPTLFMIGCTLLQNKSKPEHQRRNGLLFLMAIIIIGVSCVVIANESDLLSLPSFRYLNAINPFLTTTDPLVDSVSEHATTTIQQSFLFHSILMIFAGLGVWLIFSRKSSLNPPIISNENIAFSLIIGMLGVYVSSAFVRLEVFASISIIILSSIGLSVLIHKFMNKQSSQSKTNFVRTSSKILFISGIVVLLLLPLIFPLNGNWVSASSNPPTILNGGTSFTITTNDWKDSLEWIKQNTPEDSVIASWWDYGYWITTLSERSTLADNATIHTSKIQQIAKIFLNSPDQSWEMLNKLDVDYVVIFVSGQKLDIPSETPLYTLSGGGDESKKQWFMRIADEPLSKYLHSDGISGTDYFWDQTMLGQMFPFSLLGYVNPQNQQQQSVSYVPGFIPIYEKEIKYPINEDGPFKLVYASSSFTEEKSGPMIGVFIYEVNKNYVVSAININDS